VIERRGHVLTSEFWVSVDGEDAARVLDALPFHAVQDVTATRRHRLEVVREEQGYSIREDGQTREHLFDAESLGSSVQDRIQALALAGMASHAKLHAGCATQRGRGVLFVGPGRSGKTTLMTRLLYEGFAVQGDDTVVLRDGCAMAVPRRFRVRRGTLALVPQLSSRAPAWALEGPPNGYHVVAVDPVDLGFTWRIGPVPVEVVFFLVPGHGSPSRAIPYPRYRMASLIMSESVPPAEGARAWIREIAMLVGRAQCYVLELGELDSAVTVVNAALAGPGPGPQPSCAATGEG
jgi:hypothetical protein